MRNFNGIRRHAVVHGDSKAGHNLSRHGSARLSIQQSGSRTWSRLPRPGAWPSDGFSFGAMTTAVWVRAIYRYGSVLVILRLWSLVRVGSFQMDLRMYERRHKQIHIAALQSSCNAEYCTPSYRSTAVSNQARTGTRHGQSFTSGRRRVHEFRLLAITTRNVLK